MPGHKLNLNQISRVSSPAPHSAFSDLVAPNNESLLCCFRRAQTHISDDGIIEVVRLTRQGMVLNREYLRVNGADLRDPKLSIDHNGRIWLIAYADQRGNRRNLCWFSDTGQSWSSVHDTGVKTWWLWRLRWQDREGWGLAYLRKANRLDLYRGHPGKRLFCHRQSVLSLEKHGLGYPNESDIHFDQDNNLWALVRRDADTFTAQLGCATPPYTRWQWRDLKCYIGGPVWLPFGNGTMLVAGRQWTGKHLVTSIWLMTLQSGEMEHLFALPSTGDNSYPGLVADGDMLYVSYYSSHIDSEARVYMAALSGLNGLLDVVKQR